VYDGYVFLDSDGEYTFYTTSDDGSNLVIDGVKIVNNDGTHGAVEESGSICLQEGYHRIRVEYFDKSGSNDVLEVEYEGPNTSRRIVDELFYLPSDVVLSTKDTEKESNGVSVYPNPFENSITVSINNIKKSKIEVLNSIGEVVFSKDTNENITGIDLNNLSSGLYEIRILNDNTIITKKIIKN